MFTYDVCLPRKHISNKTLKKNKNDLGKDAENSKNSIKEGCGAKVTTRLLLIKISKYCKSNFKSVSKWLTYSQVLVCPSGLHGVRQQLIHAC